MSGRQTSVLDLLPPGQPITEPAIERAQKTAIYRSNSGFVEKELIPTMMKDVLHCLKVAQTNDDLRIVQGMYRMLDKISDHVKRGSK